MCNMLPSAQVYIFWTLGIVTAQVLTPGIVYVQQQSTGSWLTTWLSTSSPLCQQTAQSPAAAYTAPSPPKAYFNPTLNSFTRWELSFSSCMKPQIVAEPVVLRSSISKGWPKLAFVGEGCGIYKTCVNQTSQKQWAYVSPELIMSTAHFLWPPRRKTLNAIQVCTPVSPFHNLW